MARLLVRWRSRPLIMEQARFNEGSKVGIKLEGREGETNVRPQPIVASAAVLREHQSWQEMS